MTEEEVNLINIGIDHTKMNRRLCVDVNNKIVSNRSEYKLGTLNRKEEQDK